MGIQRGSLVSFSHSLTWLRSERKHEERGVGDLDLRIKFSGAPPWLCADAEAIGPSERAGRDQENHES